MSGPTITWHDTPGELAADPAATLRMGRAAWERLGATFIDVDDGQGETPALATATLSMRHAAFDFGVLDYGDGVTYALIGTVGEQRALRVHALVKALEARGVDGGHLVYDLARAPTTSVKARMRARKRKAGRPAGKQPVRVVAKGASLTRVIQLDDPVLGEPTAVEPDDD